MLNLDTDNLLKEHNRLNRQKIGKNISSIKYVNAKNPYYFFCVKDPDDNIIEITGPYDEKKDGVL